MSELTRAPDPRLQRPKPTPRAERAAPILLDIVHASSTHSHRSAKSAAFAASPPASESSSPDESIPNTPPTSTKFAATARTATTPPPSSCTPPACPPPPPCAAAAQSLGAHWCHATATAYAAADCPSPRPTWLTTTHTCSGDASTTDRRYCTCATAGRRTARYSPGPPTARLRGHANTKWKDSAARRHRAKRCTLVCHIQRLHSKHTSTPWTAHYATTCASPRSLWHSSTTIRATALWWSAGSAKLASTEAARNTARGGSRSRQCPDVTRSFWRARYIIEQPACIYFSPFCIFFSPLSQLAR